MDYTQNLHLPQWEETDRIMMDDFNDAMAAIDAAMPRIAYGSYSGNGVAATDEISIQDIALGFAPKAVLVWADRYDRSSELYLQDVYCGMAVSGSTLANGRLSVTQTGFQVKQIYDGNTLTVPTLNKGNTTYFYLAIG